MSKKLPVSFEGAFCYNIILRQDFDGLAGELAALNATERKIAIITDSHVEALYGEEVLSRVRECCADVRLFSFPAGEESKTLDTVKQVYTFLIENGFERKDFLLALGGGVVGDLTGYAAATYLRGVDFIQVPTTLLSQVDSSIGGKTGVDFDQYKNMVGAFHMPRLVYMNLTALKTLPERQFASGMGEIVKHGLIKDAAYFQWLLAHRDEIRAREAGTMEEMVYQSCLIKRNVVEKDPREQGERALLNFGHTLGHAIEKYRNFTVLHGECVALGCVAAAALSQKRGLLTESEYQDIVRAFEGFSLPVRTAGLPEEEILRLTRSDKKREAGKIKFILLEQTGHAFVDKTVSAEEMGAALQRINDK